MAAAVERRELEIELAEAGVRVSALLVEPADARWLLVLGHGAGAGMKHPFLAAMAARLAARRVATLRYQFPYTEQGRKRPDPQPRLLATVRSAIACAAGRTSAGPATSPRPFAWSPSGVTVAARPSTCAC